MIDRKVLILILLSFSHSVFGQQPVIDNVTPLISTPNASVLISGSGFSATSSQLQVWFGQVRGTISSSTEFSIEVSVPPMASLDNIEVINLASRLSGRSLRKFNPYFNGQSFDPGKLEPPLSFGPDRVFDLCACDLDLDGKPDIIGTKDVSPFTDLIVFKNTSTTGIASFTKFDKNNLPSLNVSAPTGNIACGDLNGDGKPEIIASRSGSVSNVVFVLPNTSTVGNLSFGTIINLNLQNTSDFARQVSINDLNNDGKPDIIVANSFNNELYVFQNASSGGSIAINITPIKVIVTGATGTLALEVQDFDGDKKPDIAVTQNQSNDVFILRNQSSGSISFAAATRISLFGSFTDLNSGDFNADGKLDLAMTSVFNAQVVVLLNQSTPGTFMFGTPISLATDNGPFGLEISDMNGDSFPDLIVPNRGTNSINIFLHNRNASPGFTKVNIPTSKNNWFILASDLDGDAKPDLAFSSFNSSGTVFSVDILRSKNCHTPQILNQGPLTICPAQTIRLETIAIPGVVFDWNDGTTTTSTGNIPFLDITTGGNYTVTATSEGMTCVIVSTPVLTVTSGAGTAPANPVLTSNAPLCAGATLNLSTPTVTGATYIWEGPNGFTSNLQNPTITNVSNASAGIYSLTIMVGVCTSTTTTRLIDIVDLASFSVSSNVASGIICQGQNMNLSVTSQPGHTYQWRKDGVDLSGQTGTSLVVSLQGNYSVRVTQTAAPNCTLETAPLNAIVLSLPVAAFQVNPTACLNDPVLFIDQSNVDTRATIVYAWNFGDGNTSTSQSPTNIYTTQQTFNPQLTIAYSGITGCTDSETKPVAIATATQPVITSDVSEICPGETAVLSVAGSFNSFSWSANAANATTSSVSVTLPGDYTVTTSDGNNCPGSSMFTLIAKTDCGSQTLDFPKYFSPNGDTQNDTWTINGVENFPDCTMSIFDGRGRRIFEQKGYLNPGWNGTYNGNDVPAGTYFFAFGCPDVQPMTGSVLILR